MIGKDEIAASTLTRPQLYWGRPPVPFLAGQLAEALGGALPADLRLDIGDGIATASALTAGGMAKLPADDAALERIEEHVVALAQERLLDLVGVPIAPAGLPAHLDAAVRAWPTRPRNILLRTGLVLRPERLRSLTVGELLRERMVGIRAMLEVAALLETSANLDPEHLAAEEGARSAAGAPLVLTPSRQPARWGIAPAPLLPESLRRALADERLPGWLTRDLSLPAGATTLALDTSVWAGVSEIPPRVERFVINLLTHRSNEMRHVQVLSSGWTDEIRPQQVDWPSRVRNALNRAGVFDQQIDVLTFGELLALPGLGIQSALDIAVMAEQLTARPTEVLREEQRQTLLEAANEDWASRIHANDPRFRDAVPAYHGSLAELFDEAIANPQGARARAVSEALPKIRRRVNELKSQPLDRAITDLLRAVGIPERDTSILVRRMGWGPESPASLQEVGDEFRITRERVRQVVARALKRLGPIYLPQLERSLAEIREQAPLPTVAAGELLVKSKLATFPLSPSGLVSAAEIFGYDTNIEFMNRDGVLLVIPAGDRNIGKVLTVARREAGKVGVSNIDEVQAGVESMGESLSVDAIRRMLRASSRVSVLLEDWFWVPSIPADRNRLRTVSQRMLSVTSRLDLPTLRQGIRRRYRFMQIDLVPPVDVLRAFYRAHPEFVMHDDDTLESVEPLDYRKVLGDVDRIFVEVLRESPTGMMDRSELEASVTGRGVNPSTFSVATTYSPVLDHPATNVWSLRGQPIDPAVLEALRELLATRTRVRRTIAYGWTPDGDLAITTILGNVNSPVIGIPGAVAHYIAGRSFSAVTPDGGVAGTVTVDAGGTSWGYGPFLRRRGAEPGDVLTVSFDLSGGKATLSLGDDATLEEAV